MIYKKKNNNFTLTECQIKLRFFYSTKKRVKYYYIPIWIKLVKIIYMCKLKETRIDKDKINTIHTQVHNSYLYCKWWKKINWSEYIFYYDLRFNWPLQIKSFKLIVIMSIYSKHKKVVSCIDITVNQNNRLKNSSKLNL